MELSLKPCPSPQVQPVGHSGYGSDGLGRLDLLPPLAQGPFLEDTFPTEHLSPHRLEVAALDRLRNHLPLVQVLTGTLLLGLAAQALLFREPTHALTLAASAAFPALVLIALFTWAQSAPTRTKYIRWLVYATTALLLVPTLTHAQLVPQSAHLTACLLIVFGLALFVPLWRVAAIAMSMVCVGWLAVFGASGASEHSLVGPIALLAGVLGATGLNALVRQNLYQSAQLVYRLRALEDRAALLKQKRRNAVRAHVRTQQGLQNLIERNLDGVLVLQDQQIVFANRSLRKATGWKKRDLLHQPLSHLLPDEDQDLADATLIAQESQQGLEVNLKRADDSLSLNEVRASEIEYGDGPALMLTFRPVPAVSAKTATERALLADRMITIGTIAAGVAHEINNPLAYVMANLEMLQLDLSELADERVNEHLPLVQTSLEGTHRIRQIVTDVLSFSRAAEENDEVLNVQDLLETSIRMSWNQIRHRASLVREYSEIPGVTGNSARLGQVFLNLLVNAAQSIDEDDDGQNQIGVRTQRNGEKVRIEVFDTGQGIPNDALPHIFTAFFTTKTEGKGTGLGLSFCKRVVEEMNGEITVISELGTGTRICIDLPAAEESPASKEAQTSMPPVATRPKSRKILVVDDEAAMAKSIAFILRGDEVVQAQTALEALHILDADSSFDAIVCDLMMPHHSGAKLYPMLTEQHPQMTHRVGFVTGGSFTEQTRRFMENTRCPVLLKPFRARDLLDMVASLCAPPPTD